MNPTGAQLLIQTLLDQGVTTLFGYPGGAIMPTYDALYDVRDRLHHVLVRHEQGAIHAAQGYARAAGAAGVCIATSGPGATNLITGLTDALMDSTPLVCITGQVRSTLLGSDAFQEADVMGLTLAATKWSYQVHDGREIPEVIRQAFRIARAGRPGPVLIDIPRDVQSEPVADAARPYAATGIQHPHYREWDYPRSAERLVDLERAAALINGAEQPLLMLGHGVLLARAEHEARLLAERAGLPTAVTLLGLSAMPCDHPLYVGMLGMHGNYGPNKLTNEADVIVAVGMRFDDRVTGRLDGYARQARIVHIEIDPAELNRHVPAAVGLIGTRARCSSAYFRRWSSRVATSSGWRAFRDHDREEYRVISAEIEP
ncbi:MAG: thiamine pyrophosphate-binding protein [Gammaproteobacteria bacterium]